jgi:broad specificity phosphatase PhoE
LGARSSSIAKILTSDMMRTKQTAQHIRDALAYGSQVQLVESPLLRERDFGGLQGLSWQQAMAIHGEGLFSVRVACLSAPPPRADARPQDPDFVPPNGESMSSFHARTKQAWDWVLGHAKDTPGELVVVTHGLVKYSLASRVFAVPARLATGFANTSMTVVSKALPHAVEMLNDVSHLPARLAQEVKVDARL